MDLRFLPVIPAGCVIFEREVELAGINHRPDDARKFANGSNQSVEMEREPNNAHDPNAIKVIGILKSGSRGTQRLHVGYVPREIAAKIVAGGFWETTKPRLRNIWVGDSGYIIIRFDITGRKELKKTYSAFVPPVTVDRALPEPSNPLRKIVIVGLTVLGLVFLFSLFVLIRMLRK